MRIKLTKIVDSHTLGTTFVPQTLNRIQCLQWGPADSKNETEDKNQCNDTLCLTRTLDKESTLAFNCRVIGVVDEVGSIQRKDNNEDEHEYGSRDEELRSATPFISEDCASDCTSERYEILHAVVEELG